MIATRLLIGDGVTEPDSVHWRQRLDDAVTELLEGEGDDRERLAKAAASFRLALTAFRGWPAGMRAAADALRSKLTASGRFEATVAGMEEDRVREVSDDLWRFCQDGSTHVGDGKAGALEGIDLLREARALLAGDGLDRGRLRAAAHKFWSAEFHCDSWPPELKAAAEALTAKIFRHGPIDDAVVRMGDEAAVEVKRDLLRLCDEADGLGLSP